MHPGESAKPYDHTVGAGFYPARTAGIFVFMKPNGESDGTQRADRVVRPYKALCECAGVHMNLRVHPARAG